MSWDKPIIRANAPTGPRAAKGETVPDTSQPALGGGIIIGESKEMFDAREKKDWATYEKHAKGYGHEPQVLAKWIEKIKKLDEEKDKEKDKGK